MSSVSSPGKKRTNWATANIFTDFADKFAEAIELFKKGVEDGKLQIGDEGEHIVESSFEQIPKTWTLLFDGANQGKLLTKIQ